MRLGCWIGAGRIQPLPRTVAEGIGSSVLLDEKLVYPFPVVSIRLAGYDHAG